MNQYGDKCSPERAVYLSIREIDEDGYIIHEIPIDLYDLKVALNNGLNDVRT